MKATLKEATTDIITSITTLVGSFMFIFSRPRYWRFLIIPIITNIVLSIILFILLTSAINTQLDNLFSLEAGSIWDIILGSLNYFLSIIIVAWLSISLGMIISSPFAGFLNEKILDEYGIKPALEMSTIQMIRFEIIRAVKFESIKLLLTILVLIFTFIINFIPVIGNIIYLAINYYFSSYIYTLDLTDSASSRIGYGIRKKLKEFNNNKAYYLPFGLISSLVLGLPIISFLVLPFFSAAATRLFIQKHLK